MPSSITWYQENRALFSEEQQKAFDSYVLLRNQDSDFFQMCKTYKVAVLDNINNQGNNLG